MEDQGLSHARPDHGGSPTGDDAGLDRSELVGRTGLGEPALGPVLVDEAELHAVEVALVAVASALDRLADGTYGACEICGCSMPDDVLAADPTAVRCPRHLPLQAGVTSPPTAGATDAATAVAPESPGGA